MDSSSSEILQPCDLANSGISSHLERYDSASTIHADPIEQDGAPSGTASRSISEKLSRKTRVCAIAPRKSAKNSIIYSNADDYEKKYPEDAYGEEMGPNARVWRTYLDEAQKTDDELVEHWRDTTDVLLVFAGLFSAVVAAFVIQTSAALQPNYAQFTASLAAEQVSLLRALVNGTSSSSHVSSDLSLNSDISLGDRWVNRLWFMSLSFSLSAAFVAVLVKQWIQHYVSVVSGPPRVQARIRQFRFLGVERWNVPIIIGILPTLLHLALLLYFIGLVLYLKPLDLPLSRATAVITGFSYGFYLISNLLPLWYPMCPYKTSLSCFLACCIRSVHLLASSFVRWSYITFRPASSTPPSAPAADQQNVDPTAYSQEKQAEVNATSHLADEMDTTAITWLFLKTSNPAVSNIVVQALSGLRYDFPGSFKGRLKSTIDFDVVADTFRRSESEDITKAQSARAERVARACHQLGSTMSFHAWYEIDRCMLAHSDAKLVTLHHCHSSILRSQRSRCFSRVYLQWVEENSVQHLEHYNNASIELPPFIWRLLLRCSQEQVLRDPSLSCWSHASHVLKNFLSSFRSLPAKSKREESWVIKYAIMIEYLCSMAIIATSIRPRPTLSPELQKNCDDGARIGGSPLHFSQFLVRLYSKLSTAVSEWDPHEDLHNGDYTSRANVIYVVLKEIKKFTLYCPSPNADEINSVQLILQAANHLLFKVQNVVQSNEFAQGDWLPEDRTIYLELILCRESWFPTEVPGGLSEVSWTAPLLHRILLSPSKNCKQLSPHFITGNPRLYKAFREETGLALIEWKLCGEDFLEKYLRGLLLHWKGDSKTRERELEYFFHHDNLIRMTQELVSLHDDTDKNDETPLFDWPSRLAHELLDCRSLDSVCISVAQKIVDFTRNHQIFHRSLPLETVANGQLHLDQCQYTTFFDRFQEYTALLSCRRMCLLETDYDLYEYVSGSDYQISPLEELSLLHHDAHPVYAPYAIPWRKGVTVEEIPANPVSAQTNPSPSPDSTDIKSLPNSTRDSGPRRKFGSILLRKIGNWFASDIERTKSEV